MFEQCKQIAKVVKSKYSIAVRQWFDDMHRITIRDQVCNVMASLTKTFVSQGVHPTPWRCTLSHACHAKDAETKGRQAKIHFSMVFSKSVVDGFLTIDFYWQFLQISPARCIDVKPQISCSWGMLCHGSSQRENMFSKRWSVMCRSRLTFLAFRGSPHPVPSGSVAAESSLVEFESFPVSCCHCPFHEFYHAWKSLEIIGDHWRSLESWFELLVINHDKSW